MKQILTLIALGACVCITPARAAVSCSTIRWAVTNLPKLTIQSHEKNATPAQIAHGRACLHGTVKKSTHKTKHKYTHKAKRKY